jgi:hypothetical protein
MLRFSGKWVPFQRVHSIGVLYDNWKELLAPNTDLLRSLCKFKPDWTIEPAMNEWMSVIEATDRASTYYRYPATRDQNEDRSKSPFKDTPVDELFDSEKQEGTGRMILAVENEDREIVQSFVLDDMSGENAKEALSKASETLFNYHAMMRIELTGGW